MRLILWRKAKKGEKKNSQNINEKITDAVDPRKTRILAEFNDHDNLFHVWKITYACKAFFKELHLRNLQNILLSERKYQRNL